MLRTCLVVAIAALVLGCNFSVRAVYLPDAAEQAAGLSAAVAFLEVVDKEGAAGSWQFMSKLVQSTTTESRWRAVLSDLRGAVGEPRERKLFRFTYSEELPDSPPGRYLVIDFATAFTKANKIERVVCMDEDGRWPIAGYHLMNPEEAPPAAQQGAAADAAPVLVGGGRGSFGATPFGRGLTSAAGAAQLSA